MTNLSENDLNAKLINHTRLKLSASLFMLFNNLGEMQATENPFAPYETPEDFAAVAKILTDSVVKIEDILKLPVDDRLEQVALLQKAKEKLIEASESFYCYFSLNSILTEIVVDYRRLKLLESEKEVPVDFHQFLHDVIDFIEKDERPELRAGNISYMMKCFPLSMTKEVYSDYVKNGLTLLFQGENENYITNVVKALKFRFLPTKLENYGKYFPQLKDYFNTLIELDFNSMDADALEEISQGLDDNLTTLDDMSSYLILLHESINFAILVMTFAKDLDYLLDKNMVYKDAFYFGLETIKNGRDEALSENADEMLDNIMTEFIDAIIADEKEGFLEAEDSSKYAESSVELYRITHLITHIYYEMLSDVIFNVEPNGDENSAPAEKDFIDSAAKEISTYAVGALEGIKPKTAKLIKRLFFTCIPSPYSTDEFVKYANYVIDNTMSYSKKLRILDSVGMVFDATGFIDTINGHEHEHTHEHRHEHGPDCDHDHHHH